MSVKTRTAKVNKDVLDSIICDKCQKEYFYNNPDDLLEIEEFFEIQHSCGFNSIFGDNSFIELDICQHCMSELIGTIVE